MRYLRSATDVIRVVMACDVIVDLRDAKIVKVRRHVTIGLRLLLL